MYRALPSLTITLPLDRSDLGYILQILQSEDIATLQDARDCFASGECVFTALCIVEHVSNVFATVL